MHPGGMMMGSPFGYGLFGGPYCFGGSGFWTLYFLTRWRCCATNAEGYRCNARSGMFNNFCSFHRDGKWKEEVSKKKEDKDKKDISDLKESKPDINSDINL